MSARIDGAAPPPLCWADSGIPQGDLGSAGKGHQESKAILSSHSNLL